MRTTEFAPALNEPPAGQAPVQGYEPPVIGGTWKAGCYSGEDFVLQSDGTVCCPTGNSLFPQECRREGGGSLRIVYEARIADCRACAQRPQCQWHGKEARHPSRVSVLLHPCRGGSAPLLWRDWPRREQRRACIQVVRHQQLTVEETVGSQVQLPALPPVLTRRKLAHYRLSWQERLARNARSDQAGQFTLTLHGLPDHLAAFLGLKAA